MELIDMIQMSSALAAIAMILMGSAWLKQHLRYNYF